MFIFPDIEDTKGIFEIGICSDVIFFDSFFTSIIDLDSFLDGVKGIECVVEVSRKTWPVLAFDF